jgi:hypothetical protein
MGSVASTACVKAWRVPIGPVFKFVVCSIVLPKDYAGLADG